MQRNTQIKVLEVLTLICTIVVQILLCYITLWLRQIYGANISYDDHPIWTISLWTIFVNDGFSIYLPLSALIKYLPYLILILGLFGIFIYPRFCNFRQIRRKIKARPLFESEKYFFEPLHDEVFEVIRAKFPNVEKKTLYIHEKGYADCLSTGNGISLYKGVGSWNIEDIKSIIAREYAYTVNKDYFIMARLAGMRVAKILSIYTIFFISIIAFFPVYTLLAILIFFILILFIYAQISFKIHLFPEKWFYDSLLKKIESKADEFAVNLGYGEGLYRILFAYYQKSIQPFHVFPLKKLLAPKVTFARLKNLNQYNVESIKNDLGLYTSLSYTGTRIFELGEYDDFGRATYAHIQLKASDMPEGGSRESRITFDPVGWKNQRFPYQDVEGTTCQSWLMTRGHLIGYQFSGAQNEGRNLVAMTRYLNSGTMADEMTDADNPKGMLFYEQRLVKWLRDNKDCSLDLLVYPVYSSSEDVVPTEIRMNWMGYNQNGEPITVLLGKHNRMSKLLNPRGLEEYHYSEQYNVYQGFVSLKNISPNLSL